MYIIMELAAYYINQIENASFSKKNRILSGLTTFLHLRTYKLGKDYSGINWY